MDLLAIILRVGRLWSKVGPFALLIRLSLAYCKHCGEISIFYLPGFFRNPAIKPDSLDAAEVIEFYVMWVLAGLIRYRRQKGTWELSTVAA